MMDGEEICDTHEWGLVTCATFCGLQRVPDVAWMTSS